MQPQIVCTTSVHRPTCTRTPQQNEFCTETSPCAYKNCTNLVVYAIRGKLNSSEGGRKAEVRSKTCEISRIFTVKSTKTTPIRAQAVQKREKTPETRVKSAFRALRNNILVLQVTFAMPRKCYIPGCLSNSGKFSHYTPVFSFPKNETRRERWIEAVKAEFKFITEEDPGVNACICVHHFEPELVERQPQLVSIGRRDFLK